jgi:hypothetical protein
LSAVDFPETSKLGNGIDPVPVHVEAVQMEARSGKLLLGCDVLWRGDVHLVPRVSRGLRDLQAV